MLSTWDCTRTRMLTSSSNSTFRLSSSSVQLQSGSSLSAPTSCDVVVLKVHVTLLQLFSVWPNFIGRQVTAQNEWMTAGFLAICVVPGQFTLSFCTVHLISPNRINCGKSIINWERMWFDFLWRWGWSPSFGCVVVVVVSKDGWLCRRVVAVPFNYKRNRTGKGWAKWTNLVKSQSETYCENCFSHSPFTAAHYPLAQISSHTHWAVKLVEPNGMGG